MAHTEDFSDTHSKLLSLDTYERYEQGHPGFLRDVLTVVKEIKSLRKNPRDKLTILELGPGPGTLLTQKLGSEFADKGDQVYVSENDPEAIRILHARTPAKLSANLILPKIPQVGEDPQGVVEWLKANPKLHFDAIVSNGVMHHLLPKQLDEFYALAAERLKPGGKIIMGEEHLDYTLPPNMLALLGLNDAQARAFIDLSATADRIVSNYPNQDNASLQRQYDEQLRQTETKEALQSLGLEDGIAPIELRKHLRPAVTVAHHLGYVMQTAWRQGKIKLPAMEFAALASNLSTCEEFFKTVHDEPARSEMRGQYNRLAVYLLERLTSNLEAEAQKFDNKKEADQDAAWEKIERGATQGGRVHAAESRQSVLSALFLLGETMHASRVLGIPEAAQVIDPDIRYEGNARKGDTLVPVQRCDRKMTPMELANIAAHHGFVTALKRNEGNGYTDDASRRRAMSYTDKKGDIAFARPMLGGMTVTISQRANEAERPRVISV